MSLSLFNFYTKNGLLFGDLCTQELRHDEYVLEKKTGIPHSTIIQRDEAYRDRLKIQCGVINGFPMFSRLPNREFKSIDGVTVKKENGKIYLKGYNKPIVIETYDQLMYKAQKKA